MESYPRSGRIPEDSRRSYSDGIVAYSANREIVCCFYALVFRVAALDEKYPGGHRVFLERHQGWHNEQILVVYPLEEALRRVRDDLDKHGLKQERDWVHLDEDKVKWSWDMFNFETRAPWLKGRYRKGKVYVRYSAALGQATKGLHA